MKSEKSLTQEQVIEKFIAGDVEAVCGGGHNLRIQQDKLIHYQTPIAERYGDKIIINVTRYSLVTGRLQKMLVEKIPEEKQVIVRRVAEGAKGSLKDYIE